jgi:hypothetical protein
VNTTKNVTRSHVVAGAALVSIALAGAGCNATGSKTAEQPKPRVKPDVTAMMEPSTPDGHPDLAPLAIASRGTRRLSVDQLSRSIDVIGQLPIGTVKLPDSLALALGRPDYLHVTDETLEPSPLFMKFMMDLAGSVCTNLSDYDPMRPEAQRVLTRYADEEQNLRYMLVRFTGLEGARADAYVPRLKTARAAGAQSARGEKGGWEAVCIALITSPEFLVY